VKRLSRRVRGSLVHALTVTGASFFISSLFCFVVQTSGVVQSSLAFSKSIVDSCYFRGTVLLHCMIACLADQHAHSYVYVCVCVCACAYARDVCVCVCACACMRARYDRFPTARPKLRSLMGKTLREFALVCDETAVVGPILDVMHCVISGFRTPLAPLHVALLREVLFPLHQPNRRASGGMGAVGGISAVVPAGMPGSGSDGQPLLGEYHSQLVRCELVYVERDARFAVECCEFLLAHWPEAKAGVSSKEVRVPVALHVPCCVALSCVCVYVCVCVRARTCVCVCVCVWCVRACVRGELPPRQTAAPT
jgi:hypothetical protein